MALGYRVLFIGLLAACQQDYDLVGEPVDVDPGLVTDCGFTQVGSTHFYAYDCNPVFTTTGESWAPFVRSSTVTVTEVAGHPFYQLWYAGVPADDSEGSYGLGVAVSADGITWQTSEDNPLLVQSGGSEWDADGIAGLQMVWDPDSQQYVMLYGGYNLDFNKWGLGVATSMSGQDWTRLPLNPVVDLTAGIAGVQGWCGPLGLSRGQFGGFTGYISGYDAPGGACEVYSIVASGLTQWTPQSTKLLTGGSPGSFDDEGFISLAIAELDGISYMFYVGFGDWQYFADYQVTASHFLGLATSTDGVNWSREPGPIPIHQDAAGHVAGVAAHVVGERIHVWVTDYYGDVSGVGYFLYDPYRTEESSGAE